MVANFDIKGAEIEVAKKEKALQKLNQEAHVLGAEIGILRNEIQNAKYRETIASLRGAIAETSKSIEDIENGEGVNK